jgi:hypothetical protein
MNVMNTYYAGDTGGSVAGLREVNNDITLGSEVAGLTITDTLISIGKTQLADTTVAGDLVIDGDISNAFGSLTFQGEKIVMTASGDLEVMGTVSAKKVVTEEIVLKSGGQTAGLSFIKAGTSAVFVSSGIVKSNSIVVITPEVIVDYPLSVTRKDTGSGFVVEVKSTTGKDVPFSWMIVNSED